MPGSGKSTLGREVAKQLRLPFFDLDDEIERTEGRSIKHIFEQDGEARFRKAEKEKLEEITRDHAGFVLSTGGGAPCYHNNIEFINRHGVSIFINVPLAELSARLAQTDLTERPRIGNIENLEKQLKKTLNERLAVYKMAKKEISGTQVTASDIIQLLK